MEVITFATDAYNEIRDCLLNLQNDIKKIQRLNPLSEMWLDISEVCQLLKISKRTLQSYRDLGVLPFSQIAGKIYFKASDIDKYLNDHYIKVSYKKLNN